MTIDRERILQSAQKYVDRKRYDRAIEEYQRLVQDDPNDARTLLKIGDLQTRMQAYADAVATYDRVGQYYAAHGFALKAIAVYKQIREIVRKHAPNLAQQYRHVAPRLAEIYTQLGLTSDALSAYDEIATALSREGREREALDVFRTMLGLDPENPLPYLRYAEGCCRVQAVDEAINSFWTAAELLLKLERRDDALKVVERILHFRRDPRFARVAAELYLGRGQAEDGMQALAKLQICFQDDPRNLDTLSLLAQAFTLIGQGNKAIEVYKEMARLAREQGKPDLFAQLLAHLRSVAPNDEQVRALELIDRGLSQAPPSMPPSSSVVDIDSQVEMIDDSIPPISAEPLPRTAAPRPSIPRPSTTRSPAMPPPPLPPPPVAMSRRPARAESQLPGPARVSTPDVVVVEEAYQAPEEYGPPESFDAGAFTAKSLRDAESFRKLRLYSKSIETLRIALEVDPRARDLRDKLRQVLAESGDRQGAIDETLTLAALALEDGDNDTAEALLYEVLEVEPEHPTALHLLQRFGESTETYATYEAPSVESPPLPSYGREEQPARGAVPMSEPTLPGTDLDDPFDTGAPGGVPALPSFPMGSSDDLLLGLAPQSEPRPAPSLGPKRPRMPSFSEVEADTEFANYGAVASEDLAGPPSKFGTESVEEALEEVDFFTSRGLFDDARAILNDQLKRTPRHPLVVERLREIDERLASGNASRTIERSQLGQGESDDAVFDIAASLEALDDLPAGRGTAASFSSIDEEVDVDSVFQKFKEGVRAQVDESDSATHYDLGLAYKEMALLNDAIGEFEIAARDLTRECMCFAMIGLIHREQNQLEAAAAVYKRALNAKVKTVDQELSLYYDLGDVFDQLRNGREALQYFQRIARRDAAYRDVKQRIAALQPSAAPPAAQRAVNDDEEFERAFGELFNNK